MTTTTTLPNDPDDLIDMLDNRAFPLRNFPVSATLEQVQRWCGARDVIDLLRALQKERDERIAEMQSNAFDR